MQAVQEAARLLEEQGDYNDAVKLLMGVLHRELYREDIYRLLLRCLVKDGRRAEAVKLYRRLCSLLMKEFGVEPGEETKKIIARQGKL